MVEAEADLFYDDFVSRVAEARRMPVEQVEAVARGRIWTGADAVERGLVDELGGLRDAVRRAKVLAGLDVDAEVSLVGFPGGSVRDYLRSKATADSSVGLADIATALLGSAVSEVVERGERSMSGTTALWLGQTRF